MSTDAGHRVTRRAAVDTIPIDTTTTGETARAQAAVPPAAAAFRPTPKLWFYLTAVAVCYGVAVIYALTHGLSIKALFLYGLLQSPGVSGAEARIAEIPTPLSWNIPEVLWYVFLKGSAVLVELFQYWVVGMLIAGGLIVFVPWETVKTKMGYGDLKANFLATSAGAVIPICSCGIVPVLAGMVEAGIPLGPTMAFLVAAPMLNVPTVFMTAGILGWPLATGRILATFAIALTVGTVLARWQRVHRNPRRFLKIHVAPKLSHDLQQFSFRFGMLATNRREGVRAEELGPGSEPKLHLLEEAALVECSPDGRWTLAATNPAQARSVGACAVLPTGHALDMSLVGKLAETARMGTKLFIQLNGYLLLAVIIAGAIKVLVPTSTITAWVGGTALNSVVVAASVAVLAYVCTYVEVPTALALMSKGMGPGATLTYLLGGPGLSLPSIAMLSGVFRTRVLALYVLVSFVGCVVAGYIFNLFV